MSEVEGKKKLATEQPTYEGNPVFLCASCTNNTIKMFKATEPVYNGILPFWKLLPEIPELAWICLDIKYFDLVNTEITENKYLPSDSS